MFSEKGEFGHVGFVVQYSVSQWKIPQTFTRFACVGLFMSTLRKFGAIHNGENKNFFF